MMETASIFLRPIEPNDAQIILQWENNPENFQYSDFPGPYTLQEIENLIAQAENIAENKQLRLMICLSKTKRPVGAVDLFSIDFNQKKAGVGILIALKKDRRKGYAEKALQLMADFSREKLQLKILNAEIQANNESSIQLFESAGYKKVTSKTKKKKYKDSQIDVYFYQKKLL